MEKSNEKRVKIFRGAGYLLGFLIGALLAVLFVVLTGVEALIGAIAGAVAFPLGMTLEKRFQNNPGKLDSRGRSVLVALLFSGIAFFGFICFLFYQWI